MASYTVKWYQNTMGGSPPLGDYVPGGLIGVLKGCLVDGFHNLAPTSITYDIPTDLCTATFSAAHGYLNQQIIEVSGANEAVYNGEWRVLEITELTIAWAPDTAPVGAATGTPNVRTPPVGQWEVTYHDAVGHELILKRTAGAATPYYLRVENDQDYGDQVGGGYGCWLARISTLDDYIDENNYNTVYTTYFAAGWRYTTEDWVIMADPQLFYFCNRHAVNGRRSTYMFGDINTVRPGDTGHCAVFGGKNDSSDIRWQSSGYRSHNKFAGLGNSEYRYLMTNYAQDFPPVTWQTIGYGDVAMSDEVVYPNPADNSMTYSTAPLYVMETTQILRGYLPGAIQPLARYDALHNVVLTNIPGFGGAPVMHRLTQYEDENNATQYMWACRLDDWRAEVG
jgi:hypothetical protein